jgi:hypothetical protein
MRLSLAASLLLLALAGCSGGTSTTTSPADAGGDAGGDAAGRGDSGNAPPPPTDAGGVVVARPDGGGACRAEPPSYHRPSAMACPSHETDAGRDSGILGCDPPHDACLVDSDCGGSGVCDCEDPRCTHPFATTGNVCLLGNCRVDSDCACGFCAAELTCGGLAGYWCTTPLDECATNADCQDGGTGSVCGWSMDHWACGPATPCPG